MSRVYPDREISGFFFKYLQREKKLKELLDEFHDRTFKDQMVNLEYYCTEFCLYTSDFSASDFGKVPLPSLTEIQEAQSDSILSLSEVLNYWKGLSQYFL